MRKNCKTFNQWIDSLVKDFFKAMSNSTHLEYAGASTSSSETIIIYNVKTGKSSFYSTNAHHFNDPAKVALAYAWAKYKGEYIYDNDHVELPVAYGMYATDDDSVYMG